MAVLSALRRTPGALARNPVLFVPVFVLMLFQVPQLVLQSVSPLLSSVVSLTFSVLFVFVLPFFQGGLVAMSDEALDGRTSLDTLLRAGREHYVSVLVAYLLLVAVNFAIGFVVFFAAVFGGLALFGDVSGGAGLAVLVVAGGIVALLGLAYLLFVFFVQFYGQAIVLDDAGAVDGLKRSVSVVRGHLVSTLGYSLLVGVLGGVAGTVFAVSSLLASPQSSVAFSLPDVSLAVAVGVGLVVAVVGSLFGAFFGVYSVAFYRELTHDAGAAPTAADAA